MNQNVASASTVQIDTHFFVPDCRYISLLAYLFIAAQTLKCEIMVLIALLTSFSIYF